MLKKSLFGMLILIVGVMLVFSFIGCDTGSEPGNGGNPQTVTYTGISGSTAYTLKITENTARYAAQNGDYYELTAGSKKSTGTITLVVNGVLTLTPSNASITFTVTVSGNNLSAMSGTITWNDSTTDTAPAVLTPGGNGGVEEKYRGLWSYNNTGEDWDKNKVYPTFEVTASTIIYEDNTYSGIYTHGGGTLGGGSGVYTYFYQNGIKIGVGAIGVEGGQLFLGDYDYASVNTGWGASPALDLVDKGYFPDIVGWTP
jgi:hypothetical protein